VNIDSKPKLDDYSWIEPCASAACARIAPTWPLDQFIAVNPYWGFLDQPIEYAAAKLATLSGTRLCMPRSFYRQQWQSGRVQRKHLEHAIRVTGAACTCEELLTSLDAEPSEPARLPLLCDSLDARRDLRHVPAWREFITQQISQHCAAYFDRDQAQWTPDRRTGLYASWLQHIATDHSARLLLGDRQFAARVRRLPGEYRLLLSAATRAIAPPSHALEAYFTALLLSINGWASWCAYQRWQARLNQGNDDHIVELLAIRLAWEWLLLDAGADADITTDWRARWELLAASEQAMCAAQSHDWLWQHALEIAHQQALIQGLATTPPSHARDARPAVQAIFCIDVRSEVFRRALEASGDDLQTRGFAGFFGLPIAYAALGTAMQRAQLPGLLAPTLTVSERAATTAETECRARQVQARLHWRQRWREFRASASSAFTFVEALGLTYAAALLRRSLPQPRAAMPAESAAIPPPPQRSGMRLVLHDPAAPRDELAIDRRCALAVEILTTMQLTQDFARLVVLVGHGSQSANNPHAAGLDCGACGGQSGEINARALASLLNDAALRAGLRDRGIHIPADTVFIAALHNTSTDEVELHDVDRARAQHRDEFARLTLRLVQAGTQVRAERAGALGLGEHQNEAALLTAVKRRASDWAQLRPEWGLVDNAAFIIAPRSLSEHLNLGGRAFLNDYDWRQDTQFATLEAILTGPMIVTNWINLQYYASTVDNDRYGSGNKVLHNVVGGRIGVFEGNSGDLRIGLPWQSLHDGENWRHTPLRLSVFVAAPPDAIDTLIAKHVSLRHLVEHGWLHLLCFDAKDRSVQQRVNGRWLEQRPQS